MQRTQILLEDDLDGSDATETVSFGLDGVTYEIDLNDNHSQQLRADLTRWTNAARRVGGRKKPSSTGASGRDDLNEIRAWARENGWRVSDRGRVRKDIIAAYDQSHAGALQEAS